MESYQTDGNNIIYCDIKSLNRSNKTQRMSIDISRSSTILNNPGQYLMSVVRFKIPTYKFPLFFYPDPAITPLKVSMNYNGVTVSNNVTFTQTDYGLYPNVKGYYTYESFLQDINKSIRNCCVALGIIPAPFVDQPYLIYDAATELISLIALTTYGDTYPYITALKPHLYFNQDLYNYFGNLKCVNYGRTTTGLDNLLVIENLINNTVPFPPIPASNAYQMKQEYSTLYLMNSLTSIAVASNNLPITEENTMDSDIGTVATSGKQTIKIVSDFQPIIDKGGVQRSYQYYQPNVYRYIDMIDGSNIYSIKLDFYLYSAEIKEYIPLFIDPTFAISIKLMFKRKTLNY